MVVLAQGAEVGGGVIVARLDVIDLVGARNTVAYAAVVAVLAGVASVT
ncbi:hypothetical protein OG474_09590 [Kribbella sp. NBC_01505]